MSFESPKTEKFASAQEIKNIIAMREQIAEKVGRLDNVLRKVENKLQTNSRQDESDQLEDLLNRLETRKKQAIDSIPDVPQLHPIEAIDIEIKELSKKIDSKIALRKDEREALEQRLIKLGEAKKILAEESVPGAGSDDTSPENPDKKLVNPIQVAQVVPGPVDKALVETVTPEPEPEPDPEQEPVAATPPQNDPGTKTKKESAPNDSDDSAAEKVPVDREREALVVRAREVAKKIKDLQGADKLDPDSQQFRNQNWGLVEVALIEMHQQEQAAGKTPAAVEAQPGVPLEQARNTYVQKLIQLDTKATLTDQDRAELAKAKDHYLHAYTQELAQIPVADKKARMEFAKKEADLLWGPVYAKQSQVNQQRFDRMMKLYGKKKPEGRGILSMALLGVAAIPASPILVAQHFGNQLAESHGNSYSKLMAKFLGNDKDVKTGASKTGPKPGAKTEDKKTQPKEAKDGKKGLDLTRFKPVEVEDKEKDKKEKKEKTEGENKETNKETKEEVKPEVKEAEVTNPVTPETQPAAEAPQVEAEPVEEAKSPEDPELEKKRQEHKEAIDDLLMEAYEGDPLPDYQKRWDEMKQEPVMYLLNPKLYLESAGYSDEDLRAVGIDPEEFEDYPKGQAPWIQFMFKKLAAAYNEMVELGGTIDENTTTEQFLMRALDEKLIDESQQEQGTEESEENEVPVPPTT